MIKLILTVIASILGIGAFLGKRFFSKEAVKKRRWAKVMKIRQAMTATKAKGDDEEWNRLNAEREELLKRIGKGLAIILICVLLSGCFWIKKIYVLQSESKTVWFLEKGDKITSEDKEITLEKDMVLLSEGYFEELLDYQEQAIINASP